MSNECLETSIGSFLTKINHIMSWGTTLGLNAKTPSDNHCNHFPP